MNYEPCKRPRCSTPGAIADHVIMFGENDEGRLPVCCDCAIEASTEGFEAHAMALDEDWNKLRSLEQA